LNGGDVLSREMIGTVHRVWLRLVSKVVGELELELELEVARPTVPQLPGMWPHQLAELLHAGDRVRFSIALEGRKFPALPAEETAPEVTRCRRSVSPR
jgi:hypothetical protein